MVTQQHPKPEDKAWSQKSWPPTKQQIRACGLYDGKETNQKPRNRPIKVRKMARLGAILRVKTLNFPGRNLLHSLAATNNPLPQAPGHFAGENSKFPRAKFAAQPRSHE
jgi:hypothetical protein